MPPVEPRFVNMNIYINISDKFITEIKYLFLCDPRANVVVETLYELAKDMLIDEVKTVTEEALFQSIGSNSATLSKKFQA